MHEVKAMLIEIIRRQIRLEGLILLKGQITMAAIDDLKAQVHANTDAEASAIQLLNGLSAQLHAIAGDPAQVTAMAAQLKASADALAAAVVANTPAATTVPEVAPAG